MQSKIITIFLSFSLLFSQLYSAIECSLVATEEYGRVGDVDTKEIFTKTDYIYECNTTTEKQGPCEVWESKQEDYDTSYRRDAFFKSEDFNGSSAELFNLVSAFNGVQYIWAGWKGICTDGTITDFSWAKDPLYWSSLALQAFGSDLSESIGLTGDVGKYAQCAAQAAIGAGDALLDMHDDEVPCDPVDEFCGENDVDSPDKIISVDKQAWLDAIETNPEIKDYTTVVSDSDGIVVIRFEPKNTDGMSDIDAAKENEKAKEMELMIRGIVVGIQASVCVGGVALGMDTAATSSVGDTGSATSAASILTTVVGQFNPIIGAALNIAIQLASSFQNIDSCKNKKDAEDRGSRHLKTFSHKKYGMCHEYRVEKGIKSSPFTKYDNYHYCCYPDVVSRILVEQIKAQLARGWSHCTDITFSDLEKVKFKSCTEEQMADPNTVDGKKIEYGATVAKRKKAFQYKHKCIDYTDLKDHIKNKLGEGIENFNFEEQLTGLQENNFEVDTQN